MYTCIHVSMYICVYIYRLLCDTHSWIVREANDGCKAFYSHSPFGYLMRLHRLGGMAVHFCLSFSDSNRGVVNTAAHLAVAFGAFHAPASARGALQPHTLVCVGGQVGGWVSMNFRVFPQHARATALCLCVQTQPGTIYCVYVCTYIMLYIYIYIFLLLYIIL